MTNGAEQSQGQASVPEQPKNNKQTERARSMDDVRKQLQDLQQVVGSVANDKTEEAKSAIQPQVEALRSSITKAKESGNTVEEIESEAKSSIEHANEEFEKYVESQIVAVLTLRTELTDLQQKTSATTGLRAPESSGMVGTVINTMTDGIDAVKKKIEGMNMKPQMKQFIVTFLEGLSRNILDVLEKVASSSIFKMALGDSGIQEMGELRYDREVKALARFPTVKAKYEQNVDVYRDQYLLAYKSWVANEQKGPRPQLVTIVNGGTAPVAEKPASTPEQSPGMFAAGQLERTIGGSEEIPYKFSGDTTVRLKKKEIVAKLPAASILSLELKNAAGNVLAIEKVSRTNPDLQDPATFLITVEGLADSFTFQKLVDAIKTMKENDSVVLEGSGITIAKKKQVV